jgi:signal transduction histidine kinase
MGISEESIDKIFEMFYRATEHNVGSGLGLYIVKEAITALKGDIRVESTFGEGTTFTIKIPNSQEV